MNLSSLAAAFFAVIGVTIHLPSHSAAPVNEIGFHGKVISPEIPVEELWVRLHILNLTPLEDEASDPEDFSTWLFAAGNQRSKPIRVEADGSYQLVGNAPRDQYGRLRRYAIEVSIDPPGTSWPKIGKQELLPVALHWIGPAAPRRLHEVPDLSTSRPYQISVQAKQVPGLPVPLSSLGAGLRLSRPWATQDHLPMEARLLSISMRAAGSLLHFTSVGPAWQARVQTLVRKPNSSVPAPSPVLLDRDQEIPFELPPMTWVFARIESDSVRWLNLLAIQSYPIGAGLDAETARRMPLGSFDGERTRVRHMPVLDDDFHERLSFTSPLKADPMDAIQADTSYAYLLEKAIWIPIGWLESGNYVLEAVNLENGECWRSQPLQLEPNTILQIPLEPVPNPRVTLRLDRNVAPDMVRELQAFGPDDQRLEMHYTWLPRGSGIRSIKELPPTRLPIGTTQVVLVAGHGEYQSDDTLLLTAQVPVDDIPDKGLRFRMEKSEYVLPNQSASGRIDELVIRAKGKQPASGSTGFPVIRLRGFATPHSIYGLPPGDYLGELRFREEIDHHFDILGQPTKFSTKTIEFSVK